MNQSLAKMCVQMIVTSFDAYCKMNLSTIHVQRLIDSCDAFYEINQSARQIDEA